MKVKTIITAAVTIHCLIFLVAGLSIQNGGKTVSADILSKVQKAMVSSNDSKANITMAYLACDQWNDILSQELPPRIRSLCLAFQASSLTRVGRDLDSLSSYSACLNFRNFLDHLTLQDVQLGNAYALQRLMRYQQAREQYREIPTEKACIGAATCSLRLLDMNDAIDSLTSHCQEYGTESEAADMLGCLLFLNGESDAVIGALKSGRSLSPLYSWVHFLATNNVAAHRPYHVLEFAALNQCAFDDPFLLHLDDKVHLHELLSRSPLATSFWPQGYVLSREMSTFQESHADRVTKKWIVKERAAYGSHGNRIVSGNDILCNSYSEDVLCQRIVNPTLLIDGRKFSIRVYVYFFLDENASPTSYLSSLGLVKLASMPFDEGSSDERMYMTNSGRENNMRQRDLKYLQSIFEKNDWPYESFWNEIRQSIKTLMTCYNDFATKQPKREYRSKLGKLGIPKILGLDFLVDGNFRPQLIEVNRFPGLEPRSDGDEMVKQRVVKEAWICAAERHEVPFANIGFVDDYLDDYCDCKLSFEKILMM